MITIQLYILKFVRKIIRSRKNENINDTIDRHKTQIIKKLNKKKITRDELFDTLKELEITRGSTIMVHASWRKFYNYDNSPKEFIEELIDLVGPEGTILMPSYGDNKLFFDVLNTPSKAGVLSEEFRKYPGVIRSNCSHFSICAYGKKAEDMTKYHKKSIFGFDTNSPYYIFSQQENSKVVQLGMGKYPIKLTMVHCVEFILRDYYPYFRDYLSNHYEALVKDEKENFTKRKMIEGGRARLYRRNIKKVYKTIPKNQNLYKKVGSIDCRVFNAKVAFDTIVKEIENGNSMLKPPKTYKDSFKPIK